MKTEYNSYPTETREVVDKILSIDLAERMRVIYLALLKSLEEIPRERVKASLEEYLVKGILRDLDLL